MKVILSKFHQDSWQGTARRTETKSSAVAVIAYCTAWNIWYS